MICIQHTIMLQRQRLFYNRIIAYYAYNVNLCQYGITVCFDLLLEFEVLNEVIIILTEVG